METKTKKYLSILKIELEDLIEDLEFGEAALARRLKEHEITEYVFLENVGLLKKEILGIERVKIMLNESDKNIQSIEELRNHVEAYFKDEIRSAGLPHVVFNLISRKLDKVSRYMSLEE
ncbi:MAG: hypothetical protein PQJ61_03165 [Spirochaetales bacterium]|uniref:Uncharacterized protein n=1 Tax=Candidatus Thalassospirochaeta sargassi TaxID=3119039 RepID=A0AAJ1IAJ5_9SPIO|nr:hypothetical protein [Spirochaetales bacterium]